MMPSWPQMLILIAIIVLLFGTKKLSDFGSDLGEAIKNFKKSLNDDKDSKSNQTDNTDNNTKD